MDLKLMYYIKYNFVLVVFRLKIIFQHLFTDNVQYFSEWSQFCIIKPIIALIFYIDDFHHTSEVDYGQKEIDQDTFTYNLADFINVYKTDKSSESLKYWRLRLLQDTYTQLVKAYINDYTIADSGWKEASAFNYTLDETAMAFECSLMYAFTRGNSNNVYKISFIIQTKMVLQIVNYMLLNFNRLILML